MYNPVINKLIRKDLQLNKWTLLGLGSIGILSTGLMLIPNKVLFHMGVVVFVSMLVIISCLMVIHSVVNERKQHTLPFIMSLPINIRDFTLAKILANSLGFIPIWLLLSASAFTIVLLTDRIPNGVLPFATIALIELLVVFYLLLGVALVTESEGWTIGVMTATNIAVSIFWFSIISIEQIGTHLWAKEAVWNATAITIIGLEIACLVVLIASIFHLQSRKTDFT